MNQRPSVRAEAALELLHKGNSPSTVTSLLASGVGGGPCSRRTAQRAVATAFEMLKADSARADLVLMDLRMPVMDGLQATRKIRQELGLTSLAIIALTAEIVDESWAADFNAVVNKPFEVARILLVCAHGGHACAAHAHTRKRASSQPHFDRLG